MANMYVNAMTDLWNTSGTVYSAIKMNVTNAASAAGSMLLDLRVGNVPKYTVDKDGNIFAAGTIATIGIVTSGASTPSTDDSASLGVSGTGWSDLFLAGGGVVNFGAGDATISHATNLLAFGGAANGYSFDAKVIPLLNNTTQLGALGTAWADIFLGDGAVIDFNADVQITHAAANTLAFTGASSGYVFDAPIRPLTHDVGTLGISGTAWSDLFLASGGTIDFHAGDVVITHAAEMITVSGGDLRVVTAGTNAASVVTVGGTQTLTAKTLTSPTINTPTITSPTITGTATTEAITAGGTITSSQNFVSSTTNVVLATPAAGAVYLRPNGPASSVGEAVISAAGNLSLSGTMDAGELSGTILAARLPTTAFTTDGDQTIDNGARKIIMTDWNMAQAAGSNFEFRSVASNQYAFVSFHSPGAFACNFGMHPNGNFYKGGWSLGAAVYQFWDQSNTPIGTLAELSSNAGYNRIWPANVIETRIQQWYNSAIANIMPNVAAQGGGNVGAHGMLCRDGGGGGIGVDGLIAGGALAWSNADGQLNGRPGGTWRCMGYVSSGSTNTGASTMWLRAA